MGSPGPSYAGTEWAPGRDPYAAGESVGGCQLRCVCLGSLLGKEPVTLVDSEGDLGSTGGPRTSQWDIQQVSELVVASQSLQGEACLLGLHALPG